MTETLTPHNTDLPDLHVEERLQDRVRGREYQSALRGRGRRPTQYDPSSHQGHRRYRRVVQGVYKRSISGSLWFVSVYSRNKLTSTYCSRNLHSSLPQPLSYEASRLTHASRDAPKTGRFARTSCIKCSAKRSRRVRRLKRSQPRPAAAHIRHQCALERR